MRSSRQASCSPVRWAHLVALLGVLSGCGEKPPDVPRSALELEKAFPDAVVALAAPAQPASPPPATEANAYVTRALTAVRQDDYAAGVIALQQVPNKPGVTAQQLMAVERAKQALTANLLARAAAGDAQAKAALAAIEKTRSQ